MLGLKIVFPDHKVARVVSQRLYHFFSFFSERTSVHSAKTSSYQFVHIMQIWRTGEIPQRMLLAIVVLISKGTSGDYHGIGLLEVIWKLLERDLGVRLSKGRVPQLPLRLSGQKRLWGRHHEGQAARVAGLQGAGPNVRDFP